MIAIAACFNYYIDTWALQRQYSLHILHHFLQRIALPIDVREPLPGTILAGLKI